MKVLLPVDIRGLYAANPFASELARGLESANCDVDTGRFRLGQPLKPWDVAHFQWPEHLLPGEPPTDRDIAWLETRLKELRKHSAIVVTIHNDAPHHKSGSRYDKIFQLIYSAADGFIHMGEASIEKTKLVYPAEVDGKIHQIIPHGNYVCFGSLMEKSAARGSLGLADIDTALVIGAIRNPVELEIVGVAARDLARQGRQLLFAGTISYRDVLSKCKSPRVRSLLSRIARSRALNAFRTNPGLVYQPGPIPHEKMRLYLSASDVLIIPRKKVLNSGNVALGYTFGNVVVGPSVGNVGEILRQSGNPTFPMGAGPGEIGDTLDHAFNAARSGLGESNRKIAVHDWSWENIGLLHHDFYERILRKLR